MKKIALATYAEEPALIRDDRLVLAPLAALGIEATPVRWDDQAADWGAFDAIVLRSCWDYHVKTEAFEAWLRAGHRLLNPAPTLLWNLRKSYLLELARQGVPVPRTLRIERGERIELAKLLGEAGLERAVIKPEVSLSGYRTWLTSRDASAELQPRLDEALRDGAMLVQDYIPEVETAGELSFVFIGGQFSHAIRKRPRRGDFRVHQEFGGSRDPVHPDGGLIAQAEAILRLSATDALYARVNGIDLGGKLVLIEVELIDPMLFLSYGAGAADAFARAIAARV